MEESQFKFLGYRVSSVSCEINDAFNSAQEQISQDITLGNNFNEDDPKFVEVVLDIHVKTESNNLSFRLKIKGGFKASENMPDDQFHRLAKQNGPAILYPYARSIITNYTAQANISPIILPLVNFTGIK